MCILCEGNLDYSVTALDCCSEVTEIPKEFIHLTYLNCYDNKKITEIPKELTQLEILACSNTKITEIPKELTQLGVLNCKNTQITEIPKELTQLIWLDCSNTKITEIPKEFIRHTLLYFCSDCPNLVKVPEQCKQEYIKEYNFIRVPAISRLKFNNLKRIYSENMRLQLEMRLELEFNEVYYAPSGKGALELFEKYKI